MKKDTFLFSVYDSSARFFKDNHFDVVALPKTTSTNDLAKKHFTLRSAFHPFEKNLKIFLTDHQTQGRGRGTHLWLNSMSGHSLLVTYSFIVEKPPQPLVTPRLGLALLESLNHAFSLHENLSIKPPNDIYYKNKKLSGLLIEAQSIGLKHQLNIGLGLNVWSHPPLEATSLYEQDNKESPTKLHEKNWHLFLNQLTTQFIGIARTCERNLMNQNEKLELLKSVQNCQIFYKQNLKKVIDVSSEADLILEDLTTLSWRNL